MNYIKIFQTNRLLFILAALIIYSGGASYQGFVVNVDARKNDQSAYMSYAKKMKLSNYKYDGGRNRMPVYPFLMSLFYKHNLSDEGFFIRGKAINIILSIVLLYLIFLIVQHYFTFLESLVFILITAFTVFMFRAGFFQCELLFYFLNFCLFLVLYYFLIKPSYYTGVLAGLVAACAYLTKASILPSILCFSFFYVIYHFFLPINDIIIKNNGSLYVYLKKILRSFIILVVFLTTFSLTLYPYISTSKKLFGHYFYNVNSTFYIWYDSWADVMSGTRAHGDRVGWPKMPPDQIPSIKKYLQEHTFEQLAKRLIKGSILVTKTAFFSYGFFKYLCLYFFICILIIIKDYKRFMALFNKHRNYIFLFYAGAYFFGYFLLYAFYTPISSGVRLTLAHFLPALFCMFYFLNKFEFDYCFEKIKLQINAPLIHTAVGLIFLTDLLFLLPITITRYAGR